MDRLSRPAMFMTIAQVVARRSACLRLQVGAVIVKDNRIISMGYNGVPSGTPHCDQRGGCSHNFVFEGPSCTRAIHAEMNAIAFAARAGISTDGAQMWVTHSPCIECAKILINSGIKTVTYSVEYRDQAGVTLLRDSGVEVVRFRLPGVEEEPRCT